ncbi:uncharacterized protein [Parasteatoda tepidariorum]|uniref:uncharacterized protein n=1 Tax=Parasteatoda tepidariorum TaxID=114398 RepID=UPI001C720E3C|nr:uncharacterized protein LOC107439081 [Parasteatoda tepidariorum]
MENELIPPESYTPLLPVATETSDQYQWPEYFSRPDPIRPSHNLTVGGPLQSPPQKPRLWFHKISSYCDSFIEKPFPHQEKAVMASDWRHPVGKKGKFQKRSVYETDYKWPREIQKPRGKHGVNKNASCIPGGVVQRAFAKEVTDHSNTKKSSTRMENGLLTRPNVWHTKTTYRHDYDANPTD